MLPHFHKYLNPLVAIKKLVNSVFYHPCPSRLASGIYSYILLYFFKLLRVFSIQNACWIFSDLYIPTCVGKFFSIYAVHIPTKLSKPLKTLLVEIFENLFSPRQKRWRKLWFALWKFNQKIWRCLVTLVYFHLVWLQFF